MDISRAELDSLFTGFKTSLKEGLGMANLPYERIAMEASSGTAIEKYPFLFLLSTMREWIGPRQIQNIEGKVVEVVNKDFEHTIGVSRNDIEDDNLGQYAAMFAEIEQRSFTYRHAPTRVEKAILGNEAGLYGAACLPFQA